MSDNKLSNNNIDVSNKENVIEALKILTKISDKISSWYYEPIFQKKLVLLILFLNQTRIYYALIDHFLVASFYQK